MACARAVPALLDYYIFAQMDYRQIYNIVLVGVRQALPAGQRAATVVDPPHKKEIYYQYIYYTVLIKRPRKVCAVSCTLPRFIARHAARFSSAGDAVLNHLARSGTPTAPCAGCEFGPRLLRG